MYAALRFSLAVILCKVALPSLHPKALFTTSRGRSVKYKVCTACVGSQYGGIMYFPLTIIRRVNCSLRSLSSVLFVPSQHIITYANFSLPCVTCRFL